MSLEFWIDRELLLVIELMLGDRMLEDALRPGVDDLLAAFLDFHQGRLPVGIDTSTENSSLSIIEDCCHSISFLC